MDPTHTLFAAALGLQEPWKIENVNFDSDNGQLTLELGFERGARSEERSFPIRTILRREVLSTTSGRRDGDTWISSSIAPSWWPGFRE